MQLYRDFAEDLTSKLKYVSNPLVEGRSSAHTGPLIRSIPPSGPVELILLPASDPQRVVMATGWCI